MISLINYDSSEGEQGSVVIIYPESSYLTLYAHAPVPQCPHNPITLHPLTPCPLSVKP